jgi:hypothetical protein
MLKSISNLINNNIANTELNISLLEEIDLTNLSQSDYIKYQNLIENVNSKIETNNNLINTLTTFSNSINILVTILMVLPIPTSPFPITVGLILTAGDKLNYLKTLIDNISKYLSIVDKIVSKQQANVESHKINYNNQENGLVKNSVILSDIETKINKIIANYKGNDIYLREDNTTNFKKYFAVAFDKNGKEFLRTDSSHLTNTQILIDKIKFLIDKNY